MKLTPNLPAQGKRFKVPTILQMEATECGAACLAMIFAYYRHTIPLEDLRVACGVSQHGSNAANLATVARKQGFHVKGTRCQMQFLHLLPFPLIVLWENDHFVVVEGLKKDTYYINDPAQGAHTVSAQEFKTAFSHICIALQPSPAFVPNGKSPLTPIQAMHRYVLKNIADFSYISLLTALLILPALLFPFLVRYFVDDVLLSGTSTERGFFMLLVGALFVFSVGLTILQQVAMCRFGIKVWLLEGASFVLHLLHLPLRFFQQRYPGDLALRTARIEMLGALVGGVPTISLISAVLLVFYAIAMFSISVVLTIGVLAVVGIYTVIFLCTVQRLTTASLQAGNELSKVFGIGSACLKVIETIKANEASAYLFERLAGLQANATNASLKADRETVLISILPIAAVAFINLFIIGYGGWLYSRYLLSPGDLMAFQMLALSFLTPVLTIAGLGSTLANAHSDFVRVNDVLDYRTDPHYAPPPPQKTDGQARALPLAQAGELRGTIEIKNLTFGYDDISGAVIENFSLTIHPKQRVAILGRSGCGKSTFAQLLCGLLHPWEGEILFDGRPMRQIPNEILAQSLAYVSQDIFFIDGTIRENLNLWDTSISEEAMFAALRDACIEDMVNNRPGRLDANIVGEGNNFSGGERQRLEIARALSSNPSVLILDEATSALDPIVEEEIEHQIRRRGCTCVVVAHRLSTVRDADRLIVMEKGKIIEQGTHEELLSTDGFYANRLLNYAEPTT